MTIAAAVITAAAADTATADAIAAADTAAAAPTPSETRCDVAVFGATPAGIMAAVAAARSGENVILLEPGYLVGGMMSGGLTKTDIGRRETVGGLSFEFFARVKKYYDETYGPDSTQAKECKNGLFFEPSVADRIFSDMLREAGVTVRRKERLVPLATTTGKNRIRSITTTHYETGAETTVRARVFIDATYEGDLMASAHVPYRVGREARVEYNESLAGRTHEPARYRGAGDHRVQSYNIRSTLTNRDDIRVPVPKPRAYTPGPHRHFIDYVNKHDIRTFEELFHDAPLWGPVNGKSDPNKADYPGANYAYAEADYEMRALIVERVRDYWASMWWMLQNDPALPDGFKQSARNWGLPKDEFVESGNITPQLYVREARRMLGRHLLTQNDLERDRWKPDTICMGSYNIDSHDVSFVQTPGGLTKEGFLISGVDAYEIPYRSITPIAPDNLLVTCAVSATHIAYGSLRMEPVFMMIGQAAGLAAHLALHGIAEKGAGVPPATLADGTAAPGSAGFPAGGRRSAPPSPVGKKDDGRRTMDHGRFGRARPLRGAGVPPVDAATAAATPAAPIPVQAISIPRLQAVLTAAGIPLKAPFRPVVAIVGPAGGQAVAGQPVQFAARGVHVRAPLQYYWNFDGSGEVQSTDPAPVFTFTTPKRHTISLKAVDADGTHTLVEQQTIVVGADADPDAGVTVENAKLTGRWDRGSARTMEGRGRVNHHAMDIDKNPKTATFTATLPRTGRYRVAFAFEQGPDCATALPVKITHAAGADTVLVNERERGTPFAFRPLGEFRFEAGAPAEVFITTEGVKGRVTIDEVRWLWLGE
jgi:hypothetical protein